MILPLHDLAGEIAGRCEGGRVNLVAIDGYAGSGKSFLARRLAGPLRAPIIEMDDFVSWGDLSGWWPRFEEQVIKPLASGQAARYQRRDWANDYFGNSLNEWRTVERAPIMILEGLTSSRQAIADQLTMAIFVEAPRDVMLQRGLKRDGDGMRERWLKSHRQQEEWFEEDNTRWRAEVIVDTSLPHDPETEVAIVPNDSR